MKFNSDKNISTPTKIFKIPNMKTEKGDMSGGGRDEMFFVFYLILKQTTLKLVFLVETIKLRF